MDHKSGSLLVDIREGLKAKVGSWDHRKFDDDRCMRGSATGTKNNAPPGNAGAVRL